MPRTKLNKAPRTRLNVYSRTTGDYITCYRGETPAELIAQAEKLHANECFEWDGWNRPARKD